MGTMTSRDTDLLYITVRMLVDHNMSVLILALMQSLYTEAETACQKWGCSAFIKCGVIHIHSEYIQHGC